jgi:hypothetical protein
MEVKTKSLMKIWKDCEFPTCQDWPQLKSDFVGHRTGVGLWRDLKAKELLVDSFAESSLTDIGNKILVPGADAPGLPGAKFSNYDELQALAENLTRVENYYSSLQSGLKIYKQITL